MDNSVIPIHVFADGSLEITSALNSELKLDTSNYPIQLTWLNSQRIKVQYKSTEGPSHTDMNVYGCTAIQIHLPTIEHLTCSIEPHMIIVLRLCKHKSTNGIFLICQSGETRKYSPYLSEGIASSELEDWYPSESEMVYGTPSQPILSRESDTLDLGSYSTLLKPPPFEEV
jgi:hypothetical protein